MKHLPVPRQDFPAPRRKLWVFPSGLHVLLIHRQSWQQFSKTLCFAEGLCMNKFNLTLPPQNKSPSPVTLEGLAKQLKKSMFFPSSWKSSCTMFTQRKAELNESRRTATWHWAEHFSSTVAKHKGSGGGGWGGNGAVRNRVLLSFHLNVCNFPPGLLHQIWTLSLTGQLWHSSPYFPPFPRPLWNKYTSFSCQPAVIKHSVLG